MTTHPNACQKPVSRSWTVSLTVTPAEASVVLWDDGGRAQTTAGPHASFVLMSPWTPGHGAHVRVTAPGYLPAQRDFVLPSSDAELDAITLLPELVLAPVRLRADRLAVCGDFAYTEHDGDNSAWQSYAYAGWSPDTRAQARALWHQIGMTHVAVNWALEYPAAGVAPFDFRSDPAAFAACLEELRDDGFSVFLCAAQAETYGQVRDAGDRICHDVAQWTDWGWTASLDGTWPGWESNDFLGARATLSVLRALRSRLEPNRIVGVQPGRTPHEGLIHVGDDQIDREAFWRACHAPDIALDALFFEPPTEAFDGEAWREQLYDSLMGASARVWKRIDLVPEAFPFPPHRSTARYRENWTRSGPIDGGGTPLIYWEGPAWLRWSSDRKRHAAAIARSVPGVFGSMDGI